MSHVLAASERAELRRIAAPPRNCGFSPQLSERQVKSGQGLRRSMFRIGVAVAPRYAKRSTFAGHDHVDATMKRTKDETLSIRTSADIKQLLKLAAEREHRSVASMIEVLVLGYAQEHGLEMAAEAPINAGERRGTHGTD